MSILPFTVSKLTASLVPSTAVLTDGRSLPPDEPGPPGNLKATDWDKDHVDLAWEPPRNDGGAPITGYLVEKKDKTGRWQPVFEVSRDIHVYF